MKTIYWWKAVNLNRTLSSWSQSLGQIQINREKHLNSTRSITKKTPSYRLWSPTHWSLYFHDDSVMGFKINFKRLKRKIFKQGRLQPPQENLQALLSDAGPTNQNQYFPFQIQFHWAHLLWSTATAPRITILCVSLCSFLHRPAVVVDAQPLEDSLSAGEPNFPLPLRPTWRFRDAPSGEGFQPFLLPKDSRSSTLQFPSRVGSSASPDSTSRSPVTKVTAVPLLRKWLMHSNNWNLCQAARSLCLG